PLKSAGLGCVGETNPEGTILASVSRKRIKHPLILRRVLDADEVSSEDRSLRLGAFPGVLCEQIVNASVGRVGNRSGNDGRGVNGRKRLLDQNRNQNDKQQENPSRPARFS